jgi:hypothetical protein
MITGCHRHKRLITKRDGIGLVIRSLRTALIPRKGRPSMKALSKRLLAVAIPIAVAATVTVHAAPASSFEGYSSARVNLMHEAEACGLQDSNRYSSYLADRMLAAGAGPNTSTPVMAELGLSAVSFAGSLGGKCVVTGSLAFVVPLEVSDVEVVGTATKREAIVAAFKETEMLPVVLYDSEEVTTSEPNAGDAAATDLIDALVKKFAATP